MSDKINKKIGKIIKDSREKMGLSQQTVAEYIGVSKSAISRWESGQVDNMGRSKIQLLGELLTRIIKYIWIDGDNVEIEWRF